MFEFYKMLLSIIPFQKEQTETSSLVAIKPTTPKRSSLSGFTMLANSLIFKEPKKYLGEMILVYLPAENSEPFQARIKTVRNGKIFISWTDSIGTEYKPYPLDLDNLIKEYVKPEQPIIPLVVRLLTGAGVENKQEKDEISFCNGLYSIDFDDSIVLYHFDNAIGRFDRDKQSVRRLISKCKEIDLKFFATKNKRQRREVREHNEHLDSLYDSFFGDGNVTVKLKTGEF